MVWTDTFRSEVLTVGISRAKLPFDLPYFDERRTYSDLSVRTRE